MQNYYLPLIFAGKYVDKGSKNIHISRTLNHKSTAEVKQDS